MTGQSRVMTRKEGKRKVEKKARLVAREFQDEYVNTIRTDSQICSHEGFNFDIKTNFLSINIVIHLVPSPETKVDAGRLWKLHVCMV